MPTQPSRENWTKRDDVALAIFLAWLPTQLSGKDLDALKDDVATKNAEQAAKLANLFMTVLRAPPR
jgi:hypothetical protein